MKVCSRCKNEKENIEFYPRSDRNKGKGLSSWCKSCSRKRRKSHEFWIGEKSVNTKRKQKYILQWIEYFKERYGNYPKCQICGKQLLWYGGGHRTKVVNFDHKKKDIPIIESPSQWIDDRPCGPKEIAIWEQCNFGILCFDCNKNLPTENRKEWILSALKYTEEN